jgi:hypothetical protein
MVAREMYAQKVCSRLTTLRILSDLLDDEIIIDTKEKEKAFARLNINNKINWEELSRELLLSQVKKAIAPFHKFIIDKQLTIKIRWNREGLAKINIE